MVTSRMLLVVVGNIDRARLEPLVRDARAAAARQLQVDAAARAGKLGRALVVREAHAADELPARLLRRPGGARPRLPGAARRDGGAVGRFFTEMRSRRNLSYEVEAPFVERAISNGGVYVTTTIPNATLQIMRARSTLQRELIDPRGPRAARSAVHHRLFPEERDERRPGDVSRSRADLSGRLSRGESLRRRAATRSSGRRAARRATVHARFPLRLPRQIAIALSRVARSAQF